ncbi:MAG: type II toxin-antitoxin system VapC family toxin [Thermodesulfobacteriota bacterium]|nr:type II toxin-antitoxin system VapC family toxin [Thermodesulfobacteriota bacterium]
MNLFFDTSALVKFFHEEEGTDMVTKLILDQNNKVWISELGRLEFISAVFRRFRTKELDKERLNTAVNSFEEQIAEYNIEPLGHAVLEEAELLIKNYGRTYGLKTLDALHLGSFSLISEKDWSFVVADDNLCRVAEAIGFNTINPLKENA